MDITIAVLYNLILKVNCPIIRVDRDENRIIVWLTRTDTIWDMSIGYRLEPK